MKSPFFLRCFYVLPIAVRTRFRPVPVAQTWLKYIVYMKVRHSFHFHFPRFCCSLIDVESFKKKKSGGDPAELSACTTCIETRWVLSQSIFMIYC